MVGAVASKVRAGHSKAFSKIMFSAYSHGAQNVRDSLNIFFLKAV